MSQSDQRQTLSRLRSSLVEQQFRIAKKGTQLIALQRGERSPIWWVDGYPKSGTTWLASLVADYLGLPLAQRYRLPVYKPAVVQAHWPYDPRLRPVFYIYRDGRDVMVSLYFHVMARLDDPATPRFSRRMREHYGQILGQGFDPHDAVKNLPAFIEAELTRPVHSSRISWPQHIAQWFETSRPNVAYVCYEDLLAGPEFELAQAFKNTGVNSIDRPRLSEAISRNEFHHLAGRPAGDEDRASHFRKGIAGDWRNYLSREAAETFDHYAGATLVSLGYETSRSWVSAHSGPQE